MDAEPERPRRRLLIIVNNPDFFLSHRLPIALAAREAGWDVHVATGPGAQGAARIREAGLPHHPVPLDRGGLNPVRDLVSFGQLLALIRRLRPDVVHAVTIKPVIWGGIAARLARVPGRVAAISGLGYVFIAGGVRAGVLRQMVAQLYRIALGGGGLRIIFQNESDRATMASLGVRVGPDRVRMIRGSGVSLDQFRPAPEPAGPPVVLMPSRLLIDKGLREFVDAARLLCAAGVEARFVAVGDPDPANPANVPPPELAAWRAEGVVEFPGHRADMAAVLAGAHIVVLPSYREGLPKTLIEAAAAGRAVVTTDTPGCRDAIEPDRTGLLVPLRDAPALAAAIRRLIDDPDRRRAMGAEGRALAERAFDVRHVVAEHLAIYDDLAGPPER